MSDKVLRLRYEGRSFENTMSLHEMHKVLEGLKEMLKVIYGEEGYEIYINEISPGSCNIKSAFKEYGMQVCAGLTVWAITAMVFTEGKTFSYEISGDGNVVNITNIYNESKEFNGGMDIPRILQSTKFRNAGKKITSPISDSEDTLKICKDSGEEEAKITKENKKVFMEKNNTLASEKIRGRMYEINIDAGSFKIHLDSQERKFTVKVGSHAEKTIYDFLQYMGTNDISCIGNAERNMEGEIVKFTVNDYEVAQTKLFKEE